MGKPTTYLDGKGAFDTPNRCMQPFSVNHATGELVSYEGPTPPPADEVERAITRGRVLARLSSMGTDAVRAALMPGGRGPASRRFRQ